MSILFDLRIALRQLAMRPMFVFNTVLIIAVGLALTLFSYSLLNTLMFKPLTLGDEEIISIEGQFNQGHAMRYGAHAVDMHKIRTELEYFSEFGVYQQTTRLTGKPDSEFGTQRINTAVTEWNLFEFSRQQPILGRGFAANDHHEGAQPVAVIGYALWQQLFQGKADAIGQTLMVDAKPTTIVGVMPENYAFPSSAELWLPVPQALLTPTQRHNDNLFAFTRLNSETSMAQFNQALAMINQHIFPTLPPEHRRIFGGDGQYLRALPFKQANRDVVQYRSVFLSLLGVSVAIWLLTAINVGNLLLSRVNERHKDTATKIALGVPQSRLLMQMLIESVLLCVMGGVVALLMTIWALDSVGAALDSVYQINGLKPFWWQFDMTWESLLVWSLMVISMILVTGLIPAMRAWHTDVNSALRDGTRGAQGKHSGRMSQLLVISEIFLSAIVLSIATILLLSAQQSKQADYGIDTDNRLTASIQLPSSRYMPRFDTEFEQADRQKQAQVFARLQERLEEEPNITAVALMSSLPGSGEGMSYFEIEGRAALKVTENPQTNNELAGEDAWQALGIQLLSGRSFDQRDISSEHGNVIINQAMAEAHFSGQEPLGQRIRFATTGGDAPWSTIIGVVSNTHHGAVMNTSSAAFTTYHYMQRYGRMRTQLAIHYQGEQRQVETQLREAINQIDSDIALHSVQSYQALVSQPLLLINHISQVFLFCGLVGLVLAGTGIYAVSANNISQKMTEIGVRMALGVPEHRIMMLFINSALRQLLVGLGAAMVVTLWLTGLLSDNLIFSTSSMWSGLVGVPLFIALVMLVATYIPSKRATNLEPVRAIYQ